MAHPHFHCSVAVQPLAEQTVPDRDEYAFTYTITIENRGDVTAQLIGRHWLIVDANGGEQEVHGLAVVGHQPLLAPGERFQYSSWAQIPTRHGTMSGRFLCVTEHAEVFEAEVPEFLLADTGSLH
ncbi:Co2+/Mg2+ efflux protein ApaG [Roseateles chitosanitabidus]|jgi:ApaG protein|uniref:Co2+/Mg2+ efflux protein ApaG n=1 Tax=Roseateles chitosanitabidus TaxID=65048 RepID=UPI00083111D0|nr:Co2+/Mg2+ efflux protein ApaG [Roseateles chitosanitabidus]MBO9687737.1 Co2+/Mg2+ efflux protein ApaG [Roseateles chitosanitabidus]